MIAYVVHEYPARTQTFVQREIEELLRRGIHLEVYALHGSRRPFMWVGMACGLLNLRRLSRSIREVGRRSVSVREFPRQLFSLIHGLNLAALVDRATAENEAVHIHAHFIARGADIAEYARIFIPRVVSVTATGHAGDVISPSSTVGLKRRVDRLDGVVSASEAVNSALRRQTGREGIVIHCGVESMPAWSRWRVPSGRALHIVTVARLVEKKNIDLLLKAAHEMDARGIEFEWRVIGSGPLMADLMHARDSMRMSNFQFEGHMSGDLTLAVLATWADIFVLVPKHATDGDVDGIPVAIMEAMAASVPVVSGAVGGITELVQHESTGWIVPGDSPVAVVDAVAAIVSNPAVVATTTREAHALVMRDFSIEGEVAKLLDFFSRTVSSTRGPRGSA